MEGWGRLWYRRALEALLPSWLVDRSAEEMEHLFAHRQRAALDRGGLPALLGVWLREAAGLLRTAYRARSPGPWARRTAPPRHPPPHPPPRHGPTMDHLRSDVRFAFRTFLRRPGMAALAVVTLSLGIGSSTAMFSVIDSVLLRPLDYPEPEELQAVYPSWPDLVGHPTLGDLALRGTWSWPEFWLVSEQQDVFQRLAAYESAAVTLHPEDGRPERIRVGVASWELFPMLGATTALGRLFDENDGGEGTQSVLLTYETWRDRYGSDPGILGRDLPFENGSRTVVGVLEESFQVTGVEASMWLPRKGSSTDGGLGNHGGTRALGRLAPGVGRERSRDEVQRILRTLPADHGKHGATVEPFQAELTRGVRPVLLVMLTASGLLLLVACGNVAALLLGAGIDRERELAVRGAVGASRGRIVQQLLTESLLLALAGAAGGVVLAALATRGLAFLAPPDLPRLSGVAVDGTVLGFAVTLSVACGVAFGLVPALSLSSDDLHSSMGSTRTTGSRKARLQSAVVVGELALATLLVVGGVLLARTVSALNRVDPGFDPEGLVVLSAAFPFQSMLTGDDEADVRALAVYENRMMEAIASLPGVEAVHASSAPPFFGWRGNNAVLPEGWPDPQNGPVAERRFVTPGYFGFMGIPLVEGRDFRAGDAEEGAEPVVVLSRGLAELAWPGESALGRTFHYWSVDARVVGVAADIRDEELQASTELAFYAPKGPGVGVGSPFLIRVSGDPASLVPAIRERIWSVDPDVPVTRAATMTELMAGQITDQTYRARLMGVFAALAGLFALLGIHGVTSRSVASRTREIGLRVALGADRGRVLGMVTLQAVRLAVFGVVVGLVAAVLAGGAVEAFLWGVTRTDPLTLGAVAVGLPLLAAAVAIPPARRATRVDPVVALKTE